MNPIVRPRLATLGAGLAATVIATQAASIQSLGDFPDGYWSRAFAVSADGTAIAGASYWFDGTRHAFRWTALEGLVDLGTINAATDSAATVVSGNGAVVAGFSGTEGFRLTGGILQNLGHVGANLMTTPLSATSDGGTIVGFDGSAPFRWQASTGITALPTLAGATTGEAGAITPTGSFIAGSLGLQLVRWTGTTPAALTAFPTDIDVFASSISSEGNAIGGRVLHAGGNSADALRWIEGVGASYLPDLAGGDANAAALGTTADGLTWVGYGSDSPFWTTATVWPAGGNPTRLQDVLSAQGVDLTYWDSLDEAYAISPDGRFIIGSGTVAATFFQEAFIAQITPVATPDQASYNGVTRWFPGRVQAEDYDMGGQLVAYFDTTAGNSGGQYRADAVDLVANTETPGGVSATLANREWTEYSVNVPADGSYVLRFRVAAATTGGTIKAAYAASGAPLTPLISSLTVPSTGSANTYTVIEADVSLPAGTGVLRVCGLGSSFNLNWLEVAPRGACREIWTGVTGTSTAQIPTGLAPNTVNTLTTLETPQNTGDNYGIRIRAYLCAPSTGSYRFWIASDNNSDLYLSTNANSSARRRIASVTGATKYREWGKYNSQKSVAVSLVAGQLYYIEVLQKEGTGPDHVSVGWSRPGQGTRNPTEIIPTSVLSAFLP